MLWIDFYSVMSQHHGGGGDGTPFATECARRVAKGVVTPAGIPLQELRHGNQDLSGNGKSAGATDVTWPAPKNEKTEKNKEDDESDYDQRTDLPCGGADFVDAPW